MSGGSHHPWLVVTFVCFFVATTSGAQAQTWLSDRKRAEGGGIRVGDLELHPGLGAEFGYLNNVYNDEEGNELGSAALRIAPHLFLSTLTDERGQTEGDAQPGFVRFRGGLSASLQHYFADDMPDTDFGADANLQLTLAPERPISFEVVEIFSRMFRPFADPVVDPTEGPLPSPDYVRYQETIGARLIGQTRGGLLQGGLGYRFNYNWFQEDAYAANNNLVHTVQLTGGWEFLPKTALFYEATYSHQDYTENADDADEQRLEDNDQVSTRIGINGAITSRISATVAAGYAAGFFGGNDFEGVTVNAEGRWTPSEISEWGLGYERSFTSAYLGNFVQRDQIYTRLRFFVGGAFVISSKLAVEFLEFGPDELQPDAGPREDIRYSGDLSAEYRFVSWLAVTGQLSAIIDDTDYVYALDVEGPGDDEDPAEYKAFEAWIGLRAFY